MTRRKAPAVQVPGSIDEARELAHAYASINADIAGIEAERLLRIAQVNQDCAARIARRSEELVPLFDSLKAWFEAHGAGLSGKKRSMRLGPLDLGQRLGQPSLAFDRGESGKTLLEKLLKLASEGAKFFDPEQFIRRKVDLDKDALLAALKQSASPASQRLYGMGCRLRQQDRFFIEPVASARGPSAASGGKL